MKRILKFFLPVFLILFYLNWKQSIDIPKEEKKLKEIKLELEKLKIIKSTKEIEYNSMLNLSELKKEMQTKHGMVEFKDVEFFQLND